MVELGDLLVLDERDEFLVRSRVRQERIALGRCEGVRSKSVPLDSRTTEWAVGTLGLALRVYGRCDRQCRT